jgi:hypothetical protein
MQAGAMRACSQSSERILSSAKIRKMFDTAKPLLIIYIGMSSQPLYAVDVVL